MAESPKSSRTVINIVESLLPQEEMLEIRPKKGRLFIGVPKETSMQENRVGLVPDAVALLVSNGHEVVVESGAGSSANFQDHDYSEAGASITRDTKEVYQANILMKVAPPTLEEIDMMQNKQMLISALQASVQPKNYLRQLISKKILAISWDHIMDDDGKFPVVRSMGEIAGNTAIMIAAQQLSKTSGGQGLMLGGVAGVAPCEVVILGSGGVAEYAARAAMAHGASVKIFDRDIGRLRRLQTDIGVRVFTSTLQPNVLADALKHADVAIGALRSMEGRSPCVVTENMVREMKHGSVIVDVSIDQGGCFETSEVMTHENPVFTKYGVRHYCVTNIASMVSRTASFAVSNIFAPILLEMGEEGGTIQTLKNNPHIRRGVYLFNGTLTNEYMAERHHLPFKDIDLLMAAM